MTWQKMTRRQQDYVRSLANKFGCSVSQAAKHMDVYADLDRGLLTIEQAEELTGNKITVNA